MENNLTLCDSGTCSGCIDCWSNGGTCDTCGLDCDTLVDDACASCLAIANLGCQCPKCAPVPVAIEDDRTTPVGHVTDAQLLAEFRAVRS